MEGPDLLLDTHIAVWLATDPERIPAAILNALKTAHRKLVSHVTALEIQLKNRKSPTVFRFSLQNLEQFMKEFSCTELPLAYSDIAMLGKMEFLHRDPFDRLLMSQARARSLPLVTLDKDILRTFRRYKAFPVLGLGRST